MNRTTKQIIEDLQHLTRYGGYGISDELSREIQDLISDQAIELEFLHELKRIIMEFLIADAQKGNEAILKAIMTERTLRTMLGMEGDNHGEQAQADLLDDH